MAALKGGSFSDILEAGAKGAMVGSIKGALTAAGIAPKDDGRWSQLARFVMRRPVAVVVGSLMILSILIAPIADVKFSQVDSRVLPKADRAYISSQFIANEFPGQESNPIEIIFPNGAKQTAQIAMYAEDLKSISGIVRVGDPQVLGESARLVAIHSMPPRTPEAEELIQTLRDLNAPEGTLIGGVAADYADTQGAISRTLPYVGLWIMIAVLLLLFSFTGSILLPIKAVLLNFASFSSE